MQRDYPVQQFLMQIPLVRPYRPDGGYAFNAPIPPTIWDRVQASGGAVLLEDGNPLGPADVQHTEIRNRGAGGYSVWKDHIYFSASDNTDCNDNGRSYMLVVLDLSRKTPLYRQLFDRFARDEIEILRLIESNSVTNNGFFGNFFGYYNGIQQVLQRNRIEFPKSAIELGTGRKPFTALRFLLEGVRRMVVNDVMPIERTFERQLIVSTRILLNLVKPRLANELDLLSSFEDASGVSIKGLEFHDQQPFEESDIHGQFDLIFSTSVLEHVMRPEAVLKKMTELLEPGGHVWHSIDLRDHRDPSRPLDFLMLTEEEYAPIGTENRLRSSDWIEMFSDAGLQTIECRYGTWKSAQEPEHVYGFGQPAMPWVDEARRASFCPPFNTKNLHDLSTLAIFILGRKAT